MEYVLTKEHQNLLDKIIFKAKEKMIPISYKTNYVGFGKYEKFYMFWVSINTNELLFKSRIRYKKSLVNNLVVIDVNDDNIDTIFKHIDIAYNDYFGIVNDTILLNQNAVINNEYENDNNSDFDSLSNRARNTLFRLGIRTIDELLAFNLVELVYANHCGKKTIREIVDFVKKIKEFKFVSNDNSNEDKFNYVSVFKDFNLKNVSLNIDIEDQKINKYQHLAKHIEDLVINWSSIKEKDKNIFVKYVLEGKTLQEISDELCLSKERIRIILERAFSSYSLFYVKDITMNYISSSQRQIDDLLSSLDKDEYYDFFYYGFVNYNSHYKDFIFTKLLGKENAKELLASFKDKYKLIKRHKLELEKENAMKIQYSNLLSKIKLSNNKLTYLNNDIEERKNQEKYSYVIEAKEKINRMNANLDIIFNPNVFYKLKNDNKYYPDLMLKLEDGTLVLVIVVTNLFRFILDYNKLRFKAFEEFCDEHGFASLIINSSLLTFDDVLSKANNPDGFSILDKLIEEDGYVPWRKIKKIRDENSLTNYDLIAYIEKNNYFLELNPFYIKKRK